MKKRRDAFTFLYEFILGHNTSQIVAKINRARGEKPTYDWTVWHCFLKFYSSDTFKVKKKRRYQCPIAISFIEMVSFM